MRIARSRCTALPTKLINVLIVSSVGGLGNAIFACVCSRDAPGPRAELNVDICNAVVEVGIMALAMLNYTSILVLIITNSWRREIVKIERVDAFR